MLKYFQDAFFLCTCLKIHPDGTKDFLVYLKKRIGKYELRQADELDIFFHGKKYTPKYRHVTSLYRKLSEIVERGDKNFQTNFPSFSEKDEMTFITKTAFYIDY